MKKLLMAFCICALAMLCVFALPTRAQAAREGDYAYEVSNGEATITGCTKSLEGYITIPTTLNGYPVTAIGDSAFAYCSLLNGVIIPDSVTSVGASAFYYCTTLYSVTIGEGVTTIGSNAFYECCSLSSMTIPDGVTSIEYATFYNCRNLSSVTIGNSVKTIGLYAFLSCTKLSSVVIPDGVTSIGASAFCECNSLTNVSIPKSVSYIDGGAFYGCTSLTSVTIPDGVNHIGASAFYGCTSLTSVTIPDSVNHIGASAFYGCTSLSGVTIPDGITSIDDSTFRGCSNLSSVIVPESVSYIGTSAFYGCTRLDSLFIPASVTEIERYTFYDCTALRFVYYSSTRERWQELAIATGNECLITTQVHCETVVCDFCDGEYIYCAECNTYYYRSYGSIKNHSFRNYISNNDATCTDDGTKTAKCYLCDITDTVVDYGTKLGHSFTKYVSNGNATCTADGMKTAKCDRCDKTDTVADVDSALGHSYAKGSCIRCGDTPVGVKITVQPKNTAVPSGKYATVTVKATGDGLTYAWYHKNASASKFAKAPQTGATYSAYMSSSSNGRYVYCIVRDKYGNQIKADTVKLIMGNTVKITAQPKNTVAPSGKYATVTVKATGDGLTYTWYHRNATASKFAKAPQTGATYSAYMSSSSNGRYVYCIVKDQYGNQVKTATVKLIMGNTVKITTQPKTVTVAKNAKATVSVKATGDGLTYTWYHKNASASAFAKAPQTGSSYSAYVTAASNGRYVYCIVKDKYGNQIKTNTVALRMK